MITLTEKELRTIIRESLLKVLDEAISDREFHYTMLSNLCKMMETNNLHMSSAEEGNPLGNKFMPLQEIALTNKDSNTVHLQIPNIKANKIMQE